MPEAHPGPLILAGPDDLERAVGTTLGYSAWHEVAQSRIDQFAEATGDHQWIHVDPERAAPGPFGATIAHGFLTLSLIPMLSWEIYRTQGFSMEINYGLDRVRFPSPVRVGSFVRASAVLVDVAPVNDALRVTTQLTLECRGSDRPACVADVVSLLTP